MMKRWLVAVLAAVMVLTLGVMPVSAAGFGRGNRMTDVNGDGVCDFRGEKPGFADENGNGVCDNRETGSFGGNGPVRPCCKGDGEGFGRFQRNQYCRNTESVGQNAGGKRFGFVDADENGICDRQEEPRAEADETVVCPGNGEGNLFVDADEDGVCDRREAGQENPEDGGQACTGNSGKCDGTGPKGYGRGRRNR
jgi:hypothetical protein